MNLKYNMPPNTFATLLNAYTVRDVYRGGLATVADRDDAHYIITDLMSQVPNDR